MCRHGTGWMAHNPGDEGGPHLYYINDATGTGMFQNTAFDDTGFFSVVDVVETFNHELPDLDPANQQAELLVSYGLDYFDAPTPSSDGAFNSLDQH